MITVFFWPLDLKLQNVGHISMKIGVGQSKGLETYVSWWANERSSEKSFFTQPVIPSTYEKDVQIERQPPTRTVSLSGLDEAEMKRTWQHMLATNPRYNALWSNCAGTVKALLDVGTGRNLSSAWADANNWRVAAGVWTPRRVFDYAVTLRAKYNPTKPMPANLNPSVDPYSARIG